MPRSVSRLVGAAVALILGIGAARAAALPCDAAAAAGDPCLVAYSTARPLFAAYSGPLFRVQRASDSTQEDIGIASGSANMTTLDSFCDGTSCVFVELYDQTSNHFNAYSTVYSGAPIGPEPPPVETMTLPSGVVIPYMGPGGFLNAGTRAGQPNNGPMPTGDPAMTEYMLTGPFTPVNNCCYDFGEAETTFTNAGDGTMFAIATNFIDLSAGLDQENGVIFGTSEGQLTMPFDIFAKTDGANNFTVEYAEVGNALAFPTSTRGNGSCGSTITLHNIQFSCIEYPSLDLEGGLTLGIGGDDSGYNGATAGAFTEGVVIQGQTSDATDAAIQDGINSFYAAATPPPATAPPTLPHCFLGLCRHG